MVRMPPTQILAGLLVAAAASGCQERRPDAPDPGLANVVFVSIDTLRPDHLSCYGYERDTSPHLDALAAKGILFEQAFCQAPKTGPSHMSLMTGLYPEAHGVTNWREDGAHRLSDSITTLAEVLHEAGYHTAGYVAGGHVRPELGFDRGFDHYEVVGGPENVFRKAREMLGEFQPSVRGTAPRPFFLFVHTYEVHDPYTPPTEYRHRFTAPDYGGDIIGSYSELLQRTDGDWGQQHEAFWSLVDPADPDDLQHLRALYDASIVFVDELFGDLLATLESRGLAGKTLVVFVSDHGEEFQEHRGFLHETLYQEILQVPLVLWLPGEQGRARAGERVTTPVETVHLMATLLSSLGLPVPAGVNAVSLLDVRAREEPPILFSQWPTAGMHALRKGSWKLIQRMQDGALVEELFALDLDPAEQTNRIDEQPAVAEELRALIAAYRKQCSDRRSGSSAGDALLLDDEAREQLEALGYLK